MNNIQPTSRQKEYAKNLVRNGGNRTKAALEAGYAPATAKNAKQKIESSKGWKKLVDFYFPDDFLLEEHKKNIKQDKDKGAKNKAIDMAYKLKEKYPREQGEIDAGDFKIVISKK